MELFLPEQVVLDGDSNALLGDVEETARRVNEYRPLPQEVVNRIQDGLLGERVYASNAIEGNTLDLRETVSILNTGRLIEAKRRESLEARSLGRAATAVSDLVGQAAGVHTVENLLRVHAILLTDVADYWAGRFRDVGVKITGAKYQPPDHTVVASLVERVMERLAKVDDLPIVLRAAWAHWALARIHPFHDGNGRTARLWQDLVLLQGNLTSAIIQPHERKDYLAAMTDADEGGFNPLVQLVAQRVLRTFDRYIAEIRAEEERSEFVKELVGDADARARQNLKRPYQQWARGMEQLLTEFELLAAKVSEKSKSLKLRVKRGELIDGLRWENTRAGAAPALTLFFRAYFDHVGYRPTYWFYFTTSVNCPGTDPAPQQNARHVSVVVSEGDASGGNPVRLDELRECPISLREIFVVDGVFVVRRWDRDTQRMIYEGDVPAWRIANDFVEDVVKRRLA